MNDHVVSDKLEPFDEGRISDHVHPLAPGCADFDWDELARLLGEDRELLDVERQRVADAFGRLLRWMLEPLARCAAGGATLSPRRAERNAARTLLVIGWTISPDSFGGLTLEHLGERLKMNVSALYRIRSRVREAFGDLRRV